ncbi:hypothetical protein M758_6G088600 [Ceratodon purpureus]|nr:hypothetical protein M758_6G088600 [Ceratodon purpureus]
MKLRGCVKRLPCLPPSRSKSRLEKKKNSVDQSPGSRDSVRRSPIISGYSSRSGDVEAIHFWEDGKTRESLDRSRMVQGKSPRSKSGHLVPSKDRLQTTSQYLGTQSASDSSTLRTVRATNSSRLRQELAARHREEENRRNGWTN